MLPSSVHILLVEDNPGDARLLAECLDEALGHDFRTTHCVRLEEAMASLDHDTFDIVLLDLSLPDSKGLPTFFNVHGKASYLPIVILTGFDDDNLASQAMQSGAQDYLPKNGLSGRQLARTIRYAIERKQWEETIRTREERINSVEKMEAIGRLSGGLAHNFNNILTAIIGNCELLMPLVGADDKAVRYTEAVQKAAQRASALTRQLMAFCRKQPMNAQPLSLNAILAGMEEMLHGTISNGLSFTLDCDPALGAVLSDPSQIEHVVLNLVLNAREAVSESGSIRIATRNQELPTAIEGRPDRVPPGSYAVLAVEDTGHGIDPAIMPHIFEPFFTTKETGKSPGLGLATVHGIVKQHQGFIQVASECGRGTAFTLYLPLLGASVPKRPATTVKRPTYGLETILLVEDEPQICAVLAEALSAQGYRILVAAGAEEALVTFQQNPSSINLVVSDIDMPGMKGYELAQRIKSLRPEVRIIFISGYADDSPSTARSEGLVSAFLPKPFSAQTLARTIREVMQQAQTAKA